MGNWQSQIQSFLSQLLHGLRRSELAGLMPLAAPKITCLGGGRIYDKWRSPAVRSVRLWDWKIPGVGRRSHFRLAIADWGVGSRDFIRQLAIASPIIRTDSSKPGIQGVFGIAALNWRELTTPPVPAIGARGQVERILNCLKRLRRPAAAGIDSLHARNGRSDQNPQSRLDTPSPTHKLARNKPRRKSNSYLNR
jgi:hypothetical protein